MAVSNPNTILFICEYGSLNGGERSLLALVAQELLANWKFVVAVPRNSEFSNALESAGIETVDWQVTDESGGREDQATIRNRMLDLIRAVDPAVVHANSLAMARLTGPLGGQFDGVTVGHVRDMIGLSKRATNDVNLNQHLIFVSEATRKWHARRELGVVNGRVLYNGIDPGEFHPRAATGFLHRELGISDECKLILAVGQIGLRKGFDCLLDAMPAILDQNSEIHLAIVGERFSQKKETIEFEKKLRDAAGRGSLAGHVHFLGRRDDVQRLMNEAKVLIHPARQEPLGRVLLEALASGLPMVATNVGGTPEILCDPTLHTLLIEPDDPQAIANRTNQLLAQPEFRCEVSTRQVKVSSKFHISTRAVDFDNLYREVTG